MAKVIVTNGYGTALVVLDDNEIRIQDENNRSEVHLGPATKHRIDQLIYNLQQLRTVCD